MRKETSGRQPETEDIYTRVAALRERLAADAPGYARDLAWFLATCPDGQFRDAGRAVALARKAAAAAPRQGAYWETLGVACYRAGDLGGAVSHLESRMVASAPLHAA